MRIVLVAELLLSAVVLLCGADNCPSVCICRFDDEAICYEAGLSQPPNDDIWPKIKTLYLSYNNITSITNDTFSSFPSLEILIIRYNQIESVSSDAFRNLPRLQQLSLDNNRITSLRYLDIPASLYALTLGENPLNFANGSPLPLAAGNLEAIDISLVGLEKLDLQILSGLNSLEILIAKGNNIRSIDLGNFFGLRNLLQLALDDNLIDTIIPPPDGVELQLSALSLGTNKLTFLDPAVFKALPELTLLIVSGNPITVPDNQPLLSHSYLEALDISYTYARNISALTLDLPNLEILLAENSGVHTITGAFVDKPQLETLILSFNAITDVTWGTFAKTGLLEEFDLEGNPLVSIDLEELKASLKTGCGFCYLSIDDTPLACSCGYDEIEKWVASNDGTIYASCVGHWCTSQVAAAKSRSTYRSSNYRSSLFDYIRNSTKLPHFPQYNLKLEKLKLQRNQH